MADKENNGVVNAFDPNMAKITELKDFLRDKGCPVSGVKSVLIKRALGVINIGVESMKTVVDRDVLEAKTRHVDRFVTPLGEILPPPTYLSNGWTDDINTFPPFTNNELYNYLLLNKQRTCDGASNNAKRQLKAKVFFEDRHVHSVQCNAIDPEISHTYVKSKVIPSYPTQSERKQADYDVWVCLSKVSGQVHSAVCTCAAGEGESCNHIAALLYALVDINCTKKEGLNSATSTECKWKQPRKRKLTPKKSQDLHFKKFKFEQSRSSEPKVKKLCVTKLFDKSQSPSVMNVKPVDVNSFAEKMRAFNPHAAWLYTVESSVKNNENYTKPQNYTNVEFMYRDSVDLESEECQSQFKSYFSRLECNQNLCIDIEKQTRGQSRNDTLKDMRKGLLTTSNFGLVVKRKDTTPPDGALKTILGYTEFKAASTEWGVKHEPAARRKYESVIKKTHPAMEVRQCGLVINPVYPHLGSSPDAMLCCKCNECKGNGVLEIKCPFTHRTVHPTKAAKDSAFFCEIHNGSLRLKRNHNYFYQIQGQMAVCGVSYCDFFVWTLCGYSIERIQFDSVLWDDCVNKINRFYLRFVIAERFTERVKRGLALY